MSGLPAGPGEWTSGPPPQFAFRPIPARPNYWLHLALFVLTALSTGLTGGVFYAVGIMSILLAHEMGHYLMARKYGVPATLPFFIPMPFITPFGTFGAVIRMASLGADRRVLFDIAVAGPIAGLVLAVPACFIGLSLSRIVDTASIDEAQLALGSSILFQWFTDLTFGKLPDGKEVLRHPLAFAGWAGLFVTALNLLPVGQLDGGHVIYALLGRRAHWVSLLLAVSLLGMAILVSPAWLLLAALLFLSGIRHPPTADDSVPIDARRRVVGFLLMVLFILSFTPRPISF